MTTDIEREIEQLERRYWDSMVAKEGDVAAGLTAEQALVSGARGVAQVNGETIGEIVRSELWQLKGYDFGEVVVLTPAPDLAVIAYHITEYLDVEGEHLTFEANDSSVWMRRDGRWSWILHTESIVGDPFGRDREPFQPTSEHH
jgi:hypothetical protein